MCFPLAVVPETVVQLINKNTQIGDLLFLHMCIQCIDIDNSNNRKTWVVLITDSVIEYIISRLAAAAKVQ